MRRVRTLINATIIVVAIGSPLLAKVKDVRIRGYVTVVNSATQFEIEDYRITPEEGFVLDFETSSSALRFNLEDRRVRVELEIKGSFNDATGELKAKSIKVDM